MTLLTPISPSEAANLGDLIYELILSNWGNWGQGRDSQNASVQYPPSGFRGVEFPLDLDGLPSVNGIAIAPRSDVDRCIIRYSTHRKYALPTGKPRYLNNGGLLEAETEVAVGAAYIGQVLGPIIVRADPAHWFADTYTPADVAPPSPLPAFGTALKDRFATPSLRLLLFLNAQTAFPPGHRAPFHSEFAYPFAAADVGTEALLRVVPIMGRQHVRVNVTASGGPGTVDVRASGTYAAITPGVPDTNPVPQVMTHEVPLAGPQTLDASTNGTATFSILRPQSSFLLVKATPSVAGLVLNVDVEAID